MSMHMMILHEMMALWVQLESNEPKRASDRKEK